MKKQTKVLLAAALFTLGASFSSMAALKNGTWQLNEDGWQYADKEGEYVEEEWCVSYGTEYWINEEGVLGASEWVSDAEYTYYVQSDGSKTVNAWKYIFAEDEEDADEESWFYFDAKGRMVSNTKKEINGYTYYFGEDGKMLTGWVEYDKDAKVKAIEATDKSAVSKVVYTDENGALVKSSWLHLFPYGSDEDKMYEGDDEVYYYAGSNGSLYTTKKDVEGLTYFFNKDNGQLIDGWVKKYEYDTDKYAYTACNAADEADVIELYWTDEDSYAKKNTWRYLECPEDNDDEFWYFFDKLGRAFLPNTASGSKVKEVTFADGEEMGTGFDFEAIANVESKKINGVEYFFNAEGQMLDGFVTIDGDMMYLEDGAVQTGKITITDENENDYEFMFAPKTIKEEGYKKGVAVNGNYDGYLYKNGQLVKSEENGVYELVTIENVGKFIVDYRGKIQHKDGKEYEGVTGTHSFATSAKGAKEDRIIE